MDTSDRTTAIGLFNTARSHGRSAVQLASAPPKVTHPDAPITFLLCHAIELYRKAFFRGAGRELAELKKLGHHVADLLKGCGRDWLKLSPAHLKYFPHIDAFLQKSATLPKVRGDFRYSGPRKYQFRNPETLRLTQEARQRRAFQRHCRGKLWRPDWLADDAVQMVPCSPQFPC